MSLVSTVNSVTSSVDGLAVGHFCVSLGTFFGIMKVVFSMGRAIQRLDSTEKKVEERHTENQDKLRRLEHESKHEVMTLDKKVDEIKSALDIHTGEFTAFRSQFRPPSGRHSA